MELNQKYQSLLKQGIDFHTQYADKFVAELKTFGFNFMNITTNEVSIPLACLNPAYEIVKEKLHSSNYSPISSDAKVKEISNLKKYEIEQCFDLTLRALDKVLNFIYENNLKQYITRIDYISYLIGLFVYIGDTSFDTSQENAIITWCKNVEFNNLPNSKRRSIYDELLRVKNISATRVV